MIRFYASKTRPIRFIVGVLNAIMFGYNLFPALNIGNHFGYHQWMSITSVTISSVVAFTLLLPMYRIIKGLSDPNLIAEIINVILEKKTTSNNLNGGALMGKKEGGDA